jgi:hypothetical protein
MLLLTPTNLFELEAARAASALVGLLASNSNITWELVTTETSNHVLLLYEDSECGFILINASK